MFDPHEFESIDWDEEEQSEGNLAHCLRHGVDERVVADVLAMQPVEIRMKLITAEFAIVGPDSSGRLWTLLFDRSWKRGDWLRPITGWRAKPSERTAWESVKRSGWRPKE